uniref:PH domain-containing protein n=1 Tax=Coturnix japonica TaxID=93934 RepID=A0A8C2TN11_COTJA
MEREGCHQPHGCPTAAPHIQPHLPIEPISVVPNRHLERQRCPLFVGVNGGKKAPWGRRGWKSFHAVLRGTLLCFLKVGAAPTAEAEEMLGVHHGLAEQDSHYTKRPHVFRLHTADSRVLLLQAPSHADMLAWISRLNLAAALLSSPPFPAAVGSQRRLTRHILPAAPSHCPPVSGDGGYGGLWGAMGRYGGLWGAMGRYGALWGTMGLYGALWGSMGRYGGLWGSMGCYGALWGSMGRYGALWGHMGLYGALWGAMGALWGHYGVSMGPYGVPMGSLWGHKRSSWGLWGHYGDIIGTLWGHYGDTMGSLWGHYGVSMGSLWGLYGVSMGLKGHYGDTMGTL